MTKLLATSLRALLALTLLTGLLYPAATTLLARILFPEKANGSLVRRGDRVMGSSLVGQHFGDPRWFFGRPSATAPAPYDAANSSGSNLGPTNPALFDAVRARVAALRAADPGNAAPVPVDLLTSSASGLDPHISPEAAFYQAPRVARLRRLDEAKVRALVERHVEEGTLLGPSRVNVLLLNLALDDLARG